MEVDVIIRNAKEKLFIKPLKVKIYKLLHWKSESITLDNNRIKELDFIKFVAMLMIVQGHAGGPSIPGLKFLPSVHVGLFFVCSGFLLPNNYLVSLSDFICKRIKRLYIPFVLFSILFVLLHNCLTISGGGVEIF